MGQNIRICLIDVKLPKWRHHTLGQYNILMLGSYLLEHNIVSRRDIMTMSSFHTSPFEYVKKLKPDIVGLSAVTPAFIDTKRLARKIKKYLDTIIVLGGHHISGHPESMNYPFDLGVIGEGEAVFADIVRLVKNRKRLNNSAYWKIANVVYRNQKGKLIINPMRPVLPPEKIPKIKWNLLSKDELCRSITVLKETTPVSVRFAPLFTARGCPYRCVFCSRQTLWPKTGGFRFFPVKRACDEIEVLYYQYKAEYIYILDDTFAVSKQRVRDLIQELKRRKLLGKVYFLHLYIRANLMDDEFVDLLKKFGALSVSMGIESGSPKILKYLKCGSLNIQQVKNAVRLFEKRKIYIKGSFMLFSPGETRKDIEKTYRLARWFAQREYTYTIEMYITRAMPGTKLWNDAITQGVIDPKNIDWHTHSRTIKERMKNAHFRNNMSVDEMIRYWKKFTALSELVGKRIVKMPGWLAEEHKTQTKNNRTIAINAMRNRTLGVLRNPKEAMQKVTNMNIWKRVYKDIFALIYK